jgi:hypothetical protein
MIENGSFDRAISSREVWNSKLELQNSQCENIAEGSYCYFSSMSRPASESIDSWTDRLLLVCRHRVEPT